MIKSDFTKFYKKENKMKEATWTLTCGQCNKEQLKVVVPNLYQREQVLVVFKEQHPDWTFPPKTRCPKCQGLSKEINLVWRYNKPAHEFSFEIGKYRFVGELRNNPKKVGRLLILDVYTDSDKETLEYECKSIPEGKDLAVEKIGEIIG